MSLHGQNSVPVAFPLGQEEHSMAADFSSLYASLSVCMSVEVCGQCWLFAESQSSSKATDKATAGGWVGGWRRGGRGGRGLERAQCLSSSRSSTLKKRLINRRLIGWRGHTHPFIDAGQSNPYQFISSIIIEAVTVLLIQYEVKKCFWLEIFHDLMK